MENVLLFITPKSKICFLEINFTIRQALEKMKYHRFTSVPVIDENGKYVGTISEGDLLWFITDGNKIHHIDIEEIRLSSLPRRRDNEPVKASENISSLYDVIVNQNFVPVVDDSNSFIGIITRKTILSYLTKK